MAGRGTDIKLDREAREHGGLHVILTEMHSALRIDRQFIGRSGRQGDPGSAQLFVSLEDELVRHHTPHLLGYLRALAGSDELSGPANKQAQAIFRLAQRRAEARGRRMRADVLRQDDWVEKHMPGS
jgi:preprotein translocase subunit SecA